MGVRRRLRVRLQRASAPSAAVTRCTTPSYLVRVRVRVGVRVRVRVGVRVRVRVTRYTTPCVVSG